MTTPLPPNFNYFSGSKDSSVFLKRSEADQFQRTSSTITTPSPLTIQGTGGAMTLSVNNTASYISSSTNELRINNSKTICGKSTEGTPELLISGSSGNGRVYDEVYNRPCQPGQEYTFPYSISSIISTNIGTIDAGTRGMLQARMNIIEGNGTIKFGSALKIWVQQLTGPYAKVKDYSQIIITSTMVTSNVDQGETNAPTFTSGVYQVPASENDWYIYVEAERASASNYWSLGDADVAGLFIETVRMS